MRRLFKSISLIKFSLIFLSLAVFAKTPRGVIMEVKGNAFVTSNGKTSQLRAGDYLHDFDEIFTEVGSNLTFNDYYDHRYHLSGSGHITILNQMIELKNGYLWTQSLEERSTHFHIQTVNSTVSYTHGEFIISYDNEHGKTQLLSIKGTHLFKNNVNEFLKEEVSTGKFSFVTEEYENGAPRVPTPIGSSAYTAVLSLFDNAKPLPQRDQTLETIEKFPKRRVESISGGRKVASVESKDSRSGGSVILLKKKVEKEDDRDKSLLNMYKSQVKTLAKKYKRVPKKFKPDFSKKSNVVIKVYGTKSQRVPASVSSSKASAMKVHKIEKKSSRKPASMMELNPQVNVKKDAFESSLIEEYKKQMRHSKEINSLIKDLQSYDQDYKEAY